MFCSKCGNKISENSMFCSKCGNAVAVMENEIKENQLSAIVEEKNENNVEKADELNQIYKQSPNVEDTPFQGVPMSNDNIVLNSPKPFKPLRNLSIIRFILLIGGLITIPCWGIGVIFIVIAVFMCIPIGNRIVQLNKKNYLLVKDYSIEEIAERLKNMRVENQINGRKIVKINKVNINDTNGTMKLITIKGCTWRNYFNYRIYIDYNQRQFTIKTYKNKIWVYLSDYNDGKYKDALMLIPYIVYTIQS